MSLTTSEGLACGYLLICLFMKPQYEKVHFSASGSKTCTSGVWCSRRAPADLPAPVGI